MLKKILGKTYLIGFLIIIPFSVQALEVGCSVKSMNYTVVSVTGISGEFDANDYSDTGIILTFDTIRINEQMDYFDACRSNEILSCCK